MLVDVHAHLDMVSEKDLESVINEATKNKIGKVISCATSFASNKKNIELAKTYDSIDAGIGLYPLDAQELSENELEHAFEFFETKVKAAVAIGEVGLDYKYAKSETEKEKQQDIFKQFILFAKRFDKPLIVHSRYAQRDVLRLLEEEKANKVLLHSFVDSQKLMNRAFDNDFFVSVGLNVLENELVQERVKNFPLNSLLLETDSPIRFSGERAMPKDILRVANKVAELKGITLEQVEEQLEKNFKTLFG